MYCPSILRKYYISCFLSELILFIAVMIYLLEKLTVYKFLEKTNQISSETYEYTHNFNAIIILTSDLTFLYKQ